MEGVDDVVLFWSVMNGMYVIRLCEVLCIVEVLDDEEVKELGFLILYRFLFDFVFGLIFDYF